MTTPTDAPPRTLGDLQDRDCGLILACARCDHEQRMFRDWLIARHGRDAPIAVIARAGVCTRCGRRRAEAHITWPKAWRPGH